MSEQLTISGRVVTLPDGREVGMYRLPENSFGLFFKNKDGDETRIALTQEAMNAVVWLHSEITWQTWIPPTADKSSGER